MPKLLDISSWKKHPQIHVSGTREKFIYTNKKGEKFYFKESYLKKSPNGDILREYKFEFWSEIIASKIGHLLSFNVVKYDLAYDKNKIGCISKSIINNDTDELHEGNRYITELYPGFAENFRDEHSFQKIEEVLKYNKMPLHLEKIIDMIIFDSIIGNTDRHSENWAVLLRKQEDEEIDNLRKKVPFYKKINIIWGIFLKTKKLYSFQYIIDTFRHVSRSIAPLYDNGSSLGREITEKKIKQMLANPNEIENYIERGRNEIRWGKQKLGFISLINNIREKYPKLVSRRLKHLKANYKETKIIDIINNIDNKTPMQFKHYKLSNERKKFIQILITRRIERLIDNHNENDN